ncbi:MAG: bifunctional phosphopantothenoylcysteine decarboxylase/phosphopantothenate--cysteine ligase CoaBC [Gemmatimonadaceae bacterium]
MRPLEGRRILLGITGGIASYKSVMIARLLTQAGAEVDVVMTKAALEFVGQITFEAVTGRQSHTAIFGSGNALDHIRLARDADIFVVAPATADFIARAAHGLADDLLTTALLAATCPVLIVPAMNDRMWANSQTRWNVDHLRELGARVIDPDEGPLAVGEGSGPGRMPEPEAIVSEICSQLRERSSLDGKNVLVTAGATREPIDPVRFISNHSSGRMGVALAAAASARGAKVTLVAGRMEIPSPRGVRVVTVGTTADMLNAVAQAIQEMDVLIMAAAPADFAVAQPALAKIKKSPDGAGPNALVLATTPDILIATQGQRKKGAVIVGFALETDDLLANAGKKLATKALDFIVANSAVEEGAGFGGDTNRVTILSAGGSSEEIPLMQKSELAELILDRVEGVLNERKG